MDNVTSGSISGAWLYVGVIAGAVLCAAALAVSDYSTWQRVALVLASWLLMLGEVLLIGAVLLSRDGLTGVQ